MGFFPGKLYQGQQEKKLYYLVPVVLTYTSCSILIEVDTQKSSV